LKKSSTEDSEEKYMKDWSKNSNGNIEILTEDLNDSLKKDLVDIVEIDEVYLRTEDLPTDKYISEDNVSQVYKQKVSKNISIFRMILILANCLQRLHYLVNRKKLLISTNRQN